jgi:hypothetical protein
VYVSTNNGGNWNIIGGQFTDLYSIGVNGDNWTVSNTGMLFKFVPALASIGTNIFAGTLGNGIYVSSNNGNNWSPVNNGLPEACYVLQLLSSGSNVFAGISNSNTYSQTVKLIYLSTNNGNTWINKSQGLDTVITEVWSMMVANNYIFAGTKIYSGQGEYGKSVWRRSYSEIIGIQNISNEIPSSFALHQNYPNPFNPTTKISFQFPVVSFSSLKIFDITGKEIATLVNETLKPGTYEAIFNGSQLPSGVYFYRLTADGYVETKKMLMIK